METTNSHVLSWKVDELRSGENVILDRVYGSARSGQLVGIFGKSGAGKTSLLRVLGQRCPRGFRVKGKVRLDGIDAELLPWRSLCAFVEQHDLLFNTLTCYETLMYLADLLLPRDVDRKSRVLTTLEKMELSDVAHRQCRYLSGGQRKRVSIAMQLLSEPRVLLLDEPTSGLDSQTALAVMRHLRGLSSSENLIVILTIHMPRASIVDLLDIIVLVHRGRIAFSGNLTQLEGLIETSIGGGGGGVGDSVTDTLLDNSDFLLSVYVDGGSTDVARSDGHTYASPSHVCAWRQLWTLIHRTTVLTWREKRVVWSSLAQSVFISLLVGAVFWQIDDSQAGIQSTYGVLFFILINVTFSYMMPMVTLFPVEKKVLYKEYLSATYPPWFAVVGRYIAQWSFSIFPFTLMVVILYFMIGLSGFVVYYLALLLVSANAIAVGLAIGAFASVPQVGQAISPSIAISLILVSGLYSNKQTIPSWIAWLEWISFVSYGFVILVQNEFSGKLYVCDGPPCFTSGEDVISFLQLDTISTMWSFVILCGLLAFTLLMGALGITWSFRRGAVGED